MSCGADIEANVVSASLLDGEPSFDLNIPDFTDVRFQIPDQTGNELFNDITRLTNEDLTTKQIDGSGTFDYFMSAFKAHLKNEFEQNRITGEQYTKAYIALTEGAMANATNFLLGKDASYWQAVNAQIAAQRAQVELVTSRILVESEKTRLQTLRFDAMNARANYALTKMRLAGESINYCTAKFNLEEMLPQQKQVLLKNIEQITEEILSSKARTDQIEAQTVGIVADNLLAPIRKQVLENERDRGTTENNNAMKQGELLDTEIALAPFKQDRIVKETLGVVAQTAYSAKQSELLQKEIDLAPDKRVMLLRQIANQEGQTIILTKQGVALDNEAALQPQKLALIKEQVETARAQTLDTRADGTPITGSVGKQRQLYDQQITSYKRDSEMKATKVFVDAWTVMKTIDEGLAPPTQFSNTNLDAVLGTLKINNGL